MTTARTFNRRRHERFCLVPMYTSVTARTSDQNTECELAGHAYDISESGARIELDCDFPTGETLELHFSFPSEHFDIHAKANVVRLFDEDDDPGPRRMGVEFTNFDSEADRQRLLRYLGGKHLLRAA